MKLHGAELPEGWSHGAHTSKPGERLTINWVFIYNTCGGCVTVDLVARTFTAGRGFTTFPASTFTYSGRGWKKQIVSDAIKWLEKTFQPLSNE